MQKSIFLIAVAGLMALTACSNPIAPYVDTRREAGQLTMVGKSTPEKVSICYNAASTTPTEIIDMAKTECLRHGKQDIEFAEQTNIDCSLLVPTRIDFWCK